MEEETLYDRIGEADLNPTYKDGQVYQHTDVNNMLSILKTAVNENYHDIQKLENGTKTVGNANKLSGATLSRYLDETLQADDNKIPSSQQAKAYVDDLFSSFSPPIRGVDYWTEEDQDYVINEAADQVKIKMAETIKNMGEYNSQTNYEKLNVVTYQGSSYCALKDTTGNLPTNSEYWQLYAEKGNQGPQGPQGNQGEKGDPGDLDSSAIVDNLTTNRADKVLSAKQGKVLKDLVDANKIVSDHDIINLNSALDLKANTADVASEYATKESVNDNISSLDAKVNSLASGSPLVASSVSGMTQTDKVYVNTSDGKWYYYDGDSWEIGGVYQAIGIDENDPVIVDLKLRDNARFNRLLKDADIEIYKGAAAAAQIDASTGIYSTTVDGNLQACERFVPLEIGKTYNVTRLGGGPMYNIYYYDTNKNYIRSEWPNSGMKITPVTFTNTEYGYIRFGSWKDGNSSATLETKVILKEILSFIPLVNQTKGHITSFNTINIDTVNKKLITGPTTYINVGNNLQYNIGNKEYTITDIITNGGWCYYHPDTDTIDMTPSDNAIFIGGIWQNGSKIDLFMNTESTLLINGVPYKVDSEYNNNKVLCLGDSMTAGVGTTTIYYDYLKILLGKITPYAYGVGGSSITPKQGDFPSWDTAQSFLERYNNMRNDGDVIIVFGGVNDWVAGRNLGNISSTDTYTFYGAMKSLCNGLIAKYPNKQIVFFTSPQNDYVNRPASIPSDSEYYGNTDGYNRQGLKLQDYTKAMVEVCNIYGIPCERLDTKCWYGLSGLLGDGTYGSDNLHPNENGHKIIARNMASFIKNTR